MSLAFTASPFNNENDYVDVKNGDTPITRKKQTNNRTQKRNNTNFGNSGNSGNTEKVNTLLASIHNSGGNDNEMGDFNPPSPPQSSGVQNTIMKEQMTNLGQSQEREPSSKANVEPPSYPPHNPGQMFDDEVDMNGFNEKSFAEDYYRKMIPNYGRAANNMYQQEQQQQQRQYEDPPHGAPLHQRNEFYPYPLPSSMMNQQYNNHSSGGDNVIEKLNYMINLLEESHDERTGSVTEEVILYSFLGIFIIFIADSFARVGKYTR
jgi:hypothetical protein